MRAKHQLPPPHDRWHYFSSSGNPSSCDAASSQPSEDLRIAAMSLFPSMLQSQDRCRAGAISKWMPIFLSPRLIRVLPPLEKAFIFHTDTRTSLDFESWEKPMALPRAKDDKQNKHKKNVKGQMKQGDMRPRKCPSPPIKFLFKQENKETSFSATKSFSCERRSGRGRDSTLAS